MIKIHISDNMKNEYWKDMESRTTGLFKVLNDANTKTLLRGKKEYLPLWFYFYDCKGEIKKENVKKILLADKSSMEKYIDVFGKFTSQDSNELVEKVFRYDTFSTRKCAYDILEDIDANVCPYCNRQYTVTLKNRKARPQFDHYYPKSLYPYLALTLYNLIPSCGICNQAKSSLDTRKEPILYPYEEEFGEKINFVINNKSVKAIYGLSDEFDVKIKIERPVSSSFKKKVCKQNKRLCLEELYNMHKDYIKDIAKNHYINSDDRIDELIKKFPGIFDSRDEVTSTLYMNDIRHENWGKRPLAKLTSDVVKELKKNRKKV